MCVPPLLPLGMVQVLYLEDGLAIISGLNSDAPLGTKLQFVTGAIGWVGGWIGWVGGWVDGWWVGG